MSIHFLCPFGHRLVVPDHRAGKKGRCPTCHQLVIVPVANPTPSGKPKKEWDTASAGDIQADTAKGAPLGFVNQQGQVLPMAVAGLQTQQPPLAGYPPVAQPVAGYPPQSGTAAYPPYGQAPLAYPTGGLPYGNMPPQAAPSNYPYPPPAGQTPPPPGQPPYGT